MNEDIPEHPPPSYNGMKQWILYNTYTQSYADGGAGSIQLPPIDFHERTLYESAVDELEADNYIQRERDSLRTTDLRLSDEVTERLETVQDGTIYQRRIRRDAYDLIKTRATQFGPGYRPVSLRELANELSVPREGLKEEIEPLEAADAVDIRTYTAENGERRYYEPGNDQLFNTLATVTLTHGSSK